MSCDKNLPLIERLADGECSAEEKLRAEGHLEGCDACRSHLRFLRSLSDAARRTGLPEPPGVYWEALPRKVMARIEEEQAAKASRGWFSGLLLPSRLRWLGAAAAGLIAVVLSLEMIGLRPEQSKAPTPSELMTPRGESKEIEGTSPSAKDVLGVRNQAADEPGSRVDEIRREAGEPVSEPKLEKTTPVSEPPQPASEKAAAGILANQADRVPAIEAQAEVASADARLRADYAQPAGTATGEAVEPAKSELEGGLAPAAARPPAAPVAEGGVEAGLAETAGGKGATTTFVGEPPADRGRPPRESARRARLSQAETEMDARSETELKAECARLRGLLAEDLKPDPAAELKYRLAVCSIRLFDGRGTAEARRQALADASAFLDISPQGERADALRREVKRIQDREKREQPKR